MGRLDFRSSQEIIAKKIVKVASQIIKATIEPTTVLNQPFISTENTSAPKEKKKKVTAGDALELFRNRAFL